MKYVSESRSESEYNIYAWFTCITNNSNIKIWDIKLTNCIMHVYSMYIM